VPAGKPFSLCNDHEKMLVVEDTVNEIALNESRKMQFVFFSIIT